MITTIDGLEVVGPYWYPEGHCRMIHVTERVSADRAYIRVLNDETNAQAIARAIPLGRALIKELQDSGQGRLEANY